MGLVNVLMCHITQILGIYSDIIIISNLVMFNIPKPWDIKAMGHLDGMMWNDVERICSALWICALGDTTAGFLVLSIANPHCQRIV